MAYVANALMSENPVTMPGRNGGRLRRGGTNKGGPGRTPKELRDRMRWSLAQRIHIAEKIADNPMSSATDMLRALEFLAKYGLGTTITETDTEGNDVLIRVRREPRVLIADN